MPAADTKRVLASYEALNRGDVDGTMEALAEEAVWHESGALPDTDVYEGREAIRDFLTEFLSHWSSFHQTVEETREADGRIAFFIHLEAEGRGSSVVVEERYAHIWTMENGLGVRVDAYYDRQAALSAIEP